MANKQIHELDPAPAPQSGDQIVVSTAIGQLARRATLATLPYAAPLAGAAGRTIAARLADTVSVRDFGAVGDGVADDTAAIVTALGSGARRILLPEGTYRVTAPLAVPPKVAVLGVGRNATELKLEHDGYGLSWSGAEYADGAVESLRITLPPTGTAAAIRCQGNNFRAYDLRIAGGGASAWGLELDQCNDFSVCEVLMWGDGADAFAANGIWLRNSTATAVNYGDGTLAQISIRLASDSTKGLLFDGPTTSSNIINNILISKANIIAPSRSGCRAVHIRNARRLTFVSLDMESITEGVVEEGTATDRVELNQYIGVYALNVAVPYADSNGTVPRSVFNRTFIGCDNFPALAGGGGAMADGDAMLQRGLWFPSVTSGVPTVRAIEQGGRWRVDSGGAAYVEFGPPSTGNNSRISCGVDGLPAPYDATLYLGDSAKIRKVTVDNPLHMFERTSVPPMATDQMIVFADGATWNPAWEKGLYTRAGGTWHRLLDARTRGWVPVNEQTGTSYTLQAADLGDRVEMSGSAAKTVTVPQIATVPGTAKAPGAADIVTGRKTYVETVVGQVGAGAVTLSPETGVTITGPTATAGDGQSLVVRWTAPASVRTRLVA
jgi:hypothetical protein